jgi:hypothetical protein
MVYTKVIVLYRIYNFAECFWGFAECSRHSAKQQIPVVVEQ